MQATDMRANPWKAIHDVSRHLGRLPLARRAVSIPWIGALRMNLVERAVPGRPERIFLEQEILPALASMEPRRTLFVGCRRYTAHYGRHFAGKRSEYWTMDIDPEAAIWGAPQRHVVDDVRFADRRFPAACFDLVLLNGVFGFGVDDEESMNLVLEAVHGIMRRNGILMVGWNRDLIGDPAGLGGMAARFAPAARGPLPHRRSFADEVGHVYDFYRSL